MITYRRVQGAELQPGMTVKAHGRLWTIRDIGEAAEWGRRTATVVDTSGGAGPMLFDADAGYQVRCVAARVLCPVRVKVHGIYLTCRLDPGHAEGLHEDPSGVKWTT